MDCILTFGPTRAGKSSFLNTIAGKQLTLVGDERGEATTSDVTIYDVDIESYPVRVVDVPGLEDTRLAISNKQIRERIELALLDSLCENLDAVLIFVSLATDYFTLRTSIVQLQKEFGEDVLKSVIAVFTKESNSTKKKQNYEIVCRELNIPFIYWRNNYDNDEGSYQVPKGNLDEQIRDLVAAIKEVKQYPLERVKRNKDLITERAREMQAAYPVEYETQTINVPSKTVEEYKVSVTKQRPKEVWAKGLGKVLGQKRIVYEDYQEEETRYREVDTTVQQTVQVKKAKPDLTFFLDIAKKEKVEQLRSFIKK